MENVFPRLSFYFKSFCSFTYWLNPFRSFISFTRFGLESWKCVTKLLENIWIEVRWWISESIKWSNEKFSTIVIRTNFISFSCKQCDKMYSHQQSLHNHMKKIHPELDKTTFMCSECSKRFDSEKKLKVHEQVHLPDDKKLIHPCPYCDKKFTKSVNVQAHVRSIHQLERPFLCSDCGKNFSTKGALKEHQIIHSDTYPYQCSFW